MKLLTKFENIKGTLTNTIILSCVFCAMVFSCVLIIVTKT